MSERRRGAHAAVPSDQGPATSATDHGPATSAIDHGPATSAIDHDPATSTPTGAAAPSADPAVATTPGPARPVAAAASGRHRNRGRWAGALGVALVLVLAGYLFAANARLAGGTEGRQPQDLAGLVEAEVERLEDVSVEVRALEQEVVELTEAQTADLPTLDAETARLQALAAGRQAVAGPGLTVRLTDAPTNVPRPDWATNDDLVVHQQDLQAVINALWAGGAEAMTLQDQRVVSTSAFRCVGNVLILHGRHYSPPYVVRAIGDPAELRETLLDSSAVQDYLTYVDAVGLGWSTSREERLELPAFEGSTELRFATVPDGVEVLPVPSGS